MPNTNGWNLAAALLATFFMGAFILQSVTWVMEVTANDRASYLMCSVLLWGVLVRVRNDIVVLPVLRTMNPAAAAELEERDQYGCY